MVRAPGRILVALACEGRVRVLCSVMQGPADELRERHDLQRSGALLAAEGLVAATLLSAHIKGEERLTLDVRGTRPAFAFVADVDAPGRVRGRLTPPVVPARRDFAGVLSVAKSLGPKELYRGVAEVLDERFEGALQRYLTTSQQVDARVRIDADVAGDGSVTFASGLVVERLPEMSPGEFASVFDGPLRTDFRGLMTGFAFGQLAGGRVEVLGAQDFVFQCSCSRGRVVDMLRSLGPAELAGILEEQGRAEITCHFCAERYEVGGDELRALIEGAGEA